MSIDTTIRTLERQAALGDGQAQSRLEHLRTLAGVLDPMSIVIDGETLEVSSTRQIGYGDLWELETDDGDYIVSENSETAGQAARERWQEMAENDPAEFTCIVGEQTLIAWGLGQSAGPGTTKVSSLSEWLDLWLNTPEEEFASYDGSERDVEEVGTDLVDELGFTPSVAYRSN